MILLLVALLFSLLALLLAGLAGAQLRRAEALRTSLHLLAGEAGELATALAAALDRLSSVPTPVLAGLPAPPALQQEVPAPPAAPYTATPLSELDEAVALVNDPLSERLLLLDRWERAAGLPLAEVSPVPARFRHWNRELADAQSMAQVGAAEMEIAAAWPELLEALVARSDRDLDPLRAHEPLQRALAELVHHLRLTWIDPERGDPADPARHRSLGVFRRGSPAQSGTVGETVVRGLARGEEVLCPALIREVD